LKNTQLKKRIYPNHGSNFTKQSRESPTRIQSEPYGSKRVGEKLQQPQSPGLIILIIESHPVHNLAEHSGSAPLISRAGRSLA
jgi:hypothetical protein